MNYNLEGIILDAKKIIKNDRDDYIKYLKIIERFLLPNNIIIGGKLAYKTLLKENIDSNDYCYELYSKKAFYKTKRLTKKLFDKFNDKTIYMAVSIDKYKYIIYVNFRPIAIFFELTEDINFIPYTSIFDKCKVLIISPELQLINIYYKLCNTIFFDEWGQLKNIEEKLRTYITKKIEYIKIPLHSKQNILNSIIEYSKDNVLVGVNAILLYMFNLSKINNFKHKIILITQNNLMDEIDKIKKVSVKYDVANFVFEVNSLKLPFDNRIKKVSVYYRFQTSTDSGIEHILDLYDTAQFELSPYNNINKMKIGSPPLILKFLLLDIWYEFMKYKKINKSYLYNYITFSKFINNNFEKYFTTNYIGKYENYEGHLKKLSIYNSSYYKYIPCVEN